MAKIYKQQGNYADTISCYNEVLHFYPLVVDDLVHRGNTYKEIGRVNEAIKDYSHAIIICPQMDEAYANMASFYEDSGHVEAAIKSYRKALAIHPDFPRATCNLLHTLQCVSYMGLLSTTGARYTQYLVTNEFVSSTWFSHLNSEKLVHLPHCYFVNDYKQKNLDVLDPNC
ncbi:Tetratricopeptide-like helical [Cynara cardunculus var. scolymus]|uniref:protein O-GlcNAc transferase n=1 Tax=Cynara cardunculus var. scolymus TaxID=59895 RepID=A0A103XUD9_CYNCS|nr:Tetratricopeptide-like helical [Cynara cardunculus var. scolymus]